MKRKPRVLLCSPDLALGGAQRIVSDLACAINKDDFDVSVLILEASLGTSLEAQLDEQSIPVHFFNKAAGFSPGLIPTITSFLHREKPDLVHSHTRALRYVWPAALLNRTPMLHTVHNVAEKEAGRVKWLHALAFRMGVTPVAIGATLLADLRASYRARDYPVVANGIRLERHTKIRERSEVRRSVDLAPEDFVFVSVGRLSTQKNQSLLLEAFRRVSVLQKSAKLLLVGEGEKRPLLEERIRALELSSSVRLVGNREDVPDLLAASDAFVLSSDWEGNPLCVMEAMATGLPVIATDVGSVSDVVLHRRTGILCWPGEVRQLERALMSLFADRQLRLTLGLAGQQRAFRLFGVDRMARRYEALYRLSVKTS